VQAQLPTKIGFVSPRKDVYQTAAWKSAVQQYPLLDRVASIAALPGVQAYPFVEMAQLFKDLPPIFNAVLKGQLGVATAITQAADKVKTILAQANA
jgi:ABC-type glycerol-3-phosphate transport system substrate-binding protein